MNKAILMAICKINLSSQQEVLIQKIDELINILLSARERLLKHSLNEPSPVNGLGIVRHLGADIDTLSVSYYTNRKHLKDLIEME